MIVPLKSLVMLYTELYSKSAILNEFLVRITVSNSEELFWQSRPIVSLKKKYHLLAIKNVPKYLNVSFDEGNKFQFKKYSSIKGYAICLDNYSDINEYMHDQFNSKPRNKIIKRIRRLEKSFNISYNRYFGEIDEEKCSALLNLLKEMIVRRFQERNQKSDALKNWTWFQKNLYPLILAKKASLFVIYQEEKPLSISIGYHYGSIFFSYITSYDIDYYQFGLGNIMVYKKLELCFKNKYRFLDMGWGDLDYKKRWCNHIDNLDHYILFPKYSLLFHLMAFWEGNKTRLKAYLISSKLNKIFIRSLGLIKTKSTQPKTKVEYKFENFKYPTSVDGFIPVDLTNEAYFYLKVIKNDFIYRTEEYHSDVKIYSTLDEDIYIIKGKKHFKKIVFDE